MKKFQLFSILSSGFLLLPSYFLSAQNKVDTATIVNSMLPETTVYATSANERTPFSYVNFSKKQIEKDNIAQDLPYLIRLTPSVVETSDAGIGIGYTNVRIRGIDPTRINVTINGIPLNDSESHSVYWVNIPDIASSTDGMQIQRGVGTSTNGAGAFGGTISLNTNKLEAEPWAELSATVGSFGTKKQSLAVSSGILKNKFSVETRISNVTTDGFIDRAFAKLNSVFVGANYIGKNNSLRFNFIDGHEITYQAWNGVPAQFIGDKKLRTFNSAGTERADQPHQLMACVAP